MSTDFRETPVRNPFAAFGRPVAGSDFIGRSGILRDINARVFEPFHGGNLALVGEPRIGKTSIAHHAIRCRIEELRERRKVAVWLNVGCFAGGWGLFSSLVERTILQLRQYEWSDAATISAAAKCHASTSLDGESQSNVLEFFYKVAAKGVGVIVVLDEFDAAAGLWSNDRPGFQLLRELGYDPASSVCLVTTSRRELTEIETQTGAISNLAGIFKKLYVRPFDEGEVSQYLTKLEECGLGLSANELDSLIAVTGGHPFFLAIVASELLQAGRGVDRLAVINSVAPPQFIETYEKQIQLLREDGALDKLVQVLFGPVVNVGPFDVDRFVRYGLIRSHATGYDAYSQHFQGFVRCLSREVDPWPLWRDTERALRDILAVYLHEKYGSDWSDSFVRSYPKATSVVEQWTAKRSKERSRYGDLASDDLLEYSYPGELLDILRSDWKWFGNIFGGRPNDWSRPFDVLARVRAPLAHNRVSAAYEGLIDEATGVCKQVLTRVTTWRRSRAISP